MDSEILIINGISDDSQCFYSFFHLLEISSNDSGVGRDGHGFHKINIKFIDFIKSILLETAGLGLAKSKLDSVVNIKNLNRLWSWGRFTKFILFLGQPGF